MEIVGKSTPEEFWWRAFEIDCLLPTSWREKIVRVARESARRHTIVPSSVTSRETDLAAQIPAMTVDGEVISRRLPWLVHLYQNAIRDMGASCIDEPVVCARDLKYGITLNVQTGDWRYEAHVDSNPLQGLLYVTDHPAGTGGELVVARKPDVIGIENVCRDCILIYPKAGRLIFFDARRHTHFVRQLQDPDDVRVVVAMTYYTPSCPESTRPEDLSAHLGLL